ncbi:MAG: RHS repeat domain-containing protein, partial [Burkholderiaceae bacterium]
HKHYLSAGGMVFALQVTRTGNLATGGTGGSAKPAQSLQYLHADHLGSVAVVTDDSGSVIERLAFDPWGTRRFFNGTADSSDSIVGLTLDRGYTLHEHLDEMGVIHMNGRIYDPLIGRFMSADPFIQAPENLQSHDRYAYVMNNPLNQVDPSGYKSLWMKIRGTVIRAIAAAADVFLLCSGYCSAAVGAYQGYQSGGGIGALIGGVTGYLGYHFGGQTVEAYAVRAVGGCLAAAAGGADCGRGAVAGSLNHYGASYGFWGSVTAGCISARISGGSCGDGALNAAASEAVTHVVQSAVEIYRQAERMARAYDYRTSSEAALGIVVYAPQALGAARFLWSATRLYFAQQGLARIFTMNEAANPEESNGRDAANSGADSAAGATSPPPDGDDNDKGDKQKKGKPERNVDQNKRVDDAAREAGLDKQQRRELGRYVEQGSRKYGENFGYSDIVDAAERIKGGERLINIK